MSVKSDNTKVIKSKKGGAKNKKTGPKRPMTAFFLYMIERREKLIEEDPKLKSNVKQIGRLVGDEWKNMSDEQKKPYIDTANGNKVRYQEELEKLKKNPVENTE